MAVKPEDLNPLGCWSDVPWTTCWTLHQVYVGKASCGRAEQRGVDLHPGTEWCGREG